MQTLQECLIDNQYLISTDSNRFDLETICQFLNESYWAQGITKEIIQRCLDHSLCYGIYQNDCQVGFGRVITDYTTYAYLSDIYIEKAHRGMGLSKKLVTCMLSHPELQNLRRWTLVTLDAQSLYEQFGFVSLKSPETYMEIVNTNVYQSIS